MNFQILEILLLLYHCELLNCVLPPEEEKRLLENYLNSPDEEFELTCSSEDEFQVTCSKDSKNKLDKSNLWKNANAETSKNEVDIEVVNNELDGLIFTSKTKAQADFADSKKGDAISTYPGISHLIPHRRIKLPTFQNLALNKKIDINLPPGEMNAKMKVLSLNPLIFEIENFLDEEECGLLIDIGKSKHLKPTTQHLTPMELKNPDQTFKEWDYNQDGFITPDEMLILPGLTDIKLTLEDIDDMLFMLKMDKNHDGKVDLAEMKGTDFTNARKYFQSLKSDDRRQRNMTSLGAWVWHDEDGILKYNKDGYFEEFHERISSVTGLPVELIEESEPLHVKRYGVGQYQKIRQDSEPFSRDAPCCQYGDMGKVCRLCRFISYTIFLNDVEEGGELVFPLAKHKYKNISSNSGEWRGYYVYAKTTGHKFYFQVDIAFRKEGANYIFHGEGKDESDSFLFTNAIIIGETVKFEKKYKSGDADDVTIKCHGKIIEGTKISGNWWISGHKRMRGTFFMWNKDYEIFSGRAIDQSNQKDGCSSETSLIIKPQKGKAVFWYNHHLNPRDGMVGDLNQEAMTAQCELSKGEKWIASSWLNIIGDGDLTLKAWRAGYNFLTSKSNKMRNIYRMLGTNETKLSHEPYENEFISEVVGTNISSSDTTDHPGYYKHKPASNALQALQLLFNDLSTEQLRLIAQTVHKKLGMTCIPLTIEHEGKISLVDGGVA